MELLSDARRVRHLFDAAHLALVVEAVIAGNFRATIWADDPAAPRAALLWDGSAIYLVGAVDRPDEWRELLAREVLPAVRDVVKADVPDAVAAAVLPGRRLDRRPRLFYRADPAPAGLAPAGPVPDLSAGLPRPPHALRISEVNECFDELTRLANADAVIAEIEHMWPSLDAFHQAGFGFVAHDDSTIAGWCTAEYVSPGRCGIGIETVAEFRRRGVATATARAFLARCATAGLTPHWDAWASNRPSIAVAERIGLHLVEAYQVRVGGFEE